MWAWFKRVFGATTGICVPDQNQKVTLTPPCAPETTDGSISTPLPLAGHLHHPAGVLDSSNTSSPATAAGQDAQDKAAEDQAAPRAGRYIVSAKGMPIGIANTISKYRENQPVRTHLTPFEQRVAAKLTEEQEIVAAAGNNGGSDVSSVGPVPQQLFTAAAATAGAK